MAVLPLRSSPCRTSGCCARRTGARGVGGWAAEGRGATASAHGRRGEAAVPRRPAHTAARGKAPCGHPRAHLLQLFVNFEKPAAHRRANGLGRARLGRPLGRRQHLLQHLRRKTGGRRTWKNGGAAARALIRGRVGAQQNGRYSSPLAQAESPRTKGVRKRAHLLRRQRRHQRAAVPVVHGKKGHVGGARQPQRNRVRVLRVAAEGDGGKKAAERSGGALRSARGARCGNAAPQRAARCGLPPKRTSMSTRQPASAKGVAGRAWAVGRRAWRAGDPLPPSSRRSPCMADTPASKLPFVSAEVVFSTLGLSKKAPIA